MVSSRGSSSRISPNTEDKEYSDFLRPDTNEPQNVTRSNFSFGHNDLIGKGSFGDVYNSKHMDSNTQVAIKVIHKRFDGEGFNRAMNFLRKAREWQCENIVHFYGYIQYDNSAWLILKLMDYSLSNSMAKLRYCNANRHIDYDTDKWPVNVIENLGYIMLKNIANGLQVVHGSNPNGEVFMHRDIKPTNIMIDKEHRKLAIIDFQSSKHIASEHPRLIHSVGVGCPKYTAPECVLDSPVYDEKCDIWSVGIVVMFYLTGVHPIFDENREESSSSGFEISQKKIYDRITGNIDWPVELISEFLSEEFKSLINRCVSRDPELRPTAAELYEIATIKVDKFGQDVEQQIFDMFLGETSPVETVDKADVKISISNVGATKTEETETIKVEGDIEIHSSVFNCISSASKGNLAPEIGVLELIGKGSFAIVYKFTPSGVTNVSNLVIKVEELHEPSYQREIQHTKQLCHHNVIKYYGEPINYNGKICYVLEYGGESIEKRYFKRSKMPEHEIKKAMFDVAAGINYLHSGLKYIIIHRNLCSSNVTVTGNGVYKIIGFSISRRTTVENPRYEFDTYLGHPFWKSPEYCRYMKALWNEGTPGTLPPGRKSDIWSFGVTILQMTSFPERPDYFNLSCYDKQGYGKYTYINDLAEGKIVLADYINTQDILLADVLKKCFATNEEARVDSKKLKELCETLVIGKQVFTKSNFSFSYRDRIGKGSFGEVYNAKHLDSNTRVAIKVIHNIDMCRGRTAPAETFNVEMDFLRKASEWECENIVHFYGYIQFDNTAWLILKLMDYSLSNSMAKLRYCNTNGSGRIDYDTDKWPANIIENLGYIMLKNIANGLKVVHGSNPNGEVFMHRDIKPSNIMIDKEHRKLAITDFASTKEIARDYLRLQSQNSEFPIYAAPEGMGSPVYDEKCDIWSVGIVVIFYLTGVHPIFDENREQSSSSGFEIFKIYQRITGNIEWPVELISEFLSKEFKSLINRCVSRDPKLRPTAAELYEIATIKVDKFGQDAEQQIFDMFLAAPRDAVDTTPKASGSLIERAGKVDILTATQPAINPQQQITPAPRDLAVNSAYIITAVVLGEGGFSTVYKGYDKHTGEAVAIKKSTQKRGKRPLRKELDILKRLPRHDNIIKVLEYFETDKNSFIVLELCEGQSLESFMRRNLDNAFGVGVDDFHNALIDISAGYKHLKENRIAHRDIKPGNIMISLNDRKGSATYKLADLGSAKEYLEEDPDSSQQLNSIIGTPIYMDPYILDRYLEDKKRSTWSPTKQRSRYSPDVDMWSIGCTLLFIACNCSAFIASTANGLIQLYNTRGPKTLMGSNNQGKMVFSENFREVSPINQNTSEFLRSKYKTIILGCLKPLEERSTSEYFKQIQEIESLGLCYKININEGCGYYDVINHPGNVDKNVETFSVKSTDHFCEALNVKVPVIFVCSKVTNSQSQNVEIARPPYNVIVSDPIGSQRRVIKSQCEAIQCVVAIIKQSNFNINMLKHLGLLLLSDDEYNDIENNYISKFSNLVSIIFRIYSVIVGIYDDIQHISDRAELDSLQTKCGKLEKDLVAKLSEHRTIIFGRKGDTALLHALCTSIVTSISDCKGVIKNKTVYSGDLKNR